ncbi:MAG: leucine-rich repeat protein [Oscillospiraceae bacterium]|nr:leucine-rich repeat protein [Oscillospiraceae bacterium]
MIKKCLSALVSTVMCFTMLMTDCYPGIKTEAPAAMPDQPAVKQQVQVKGTNSVGSFVADSISKSDSNNFANNLSATSPSEEIFSISNLGFDNLTGSIVVSSTQTNICQAVVVFVDEETGDIVQEVETIIGAGSNTDTILQADLDLLPEYYFVRAMLTDTNGKILSNTYQIAEYTKELQEIAQTDMEDFPDKKVINLDENEDTNFLVLCDETVIAETTETANVLVSADYDNNVFVFSDITEEISGLKKDDYFFIQPNAYDIIATKIANITIDGDTATITGDSDIADMFDFIKIEAAAGTDAGVTREPTYTPPTQALPHATQMVRPDGGAIGVPTEDLRDNPDDAPFYLETTDDGVVAHIKFASDKTDFSLTFSGTLEIVPKVKYYKEDEKEYTELNADFHLTGDVTGGYENGEKATKWNNTAGAIDKVKHLINDTTTTVFDYPLGYIVIPLGVSGIAVYVDLAVHFKISGELAVTLQADYNYHSIFTTKFWMIPCDTESEFNTIRPLRATKITLTGTLEFELSVGVGISFVAVFSVGFELTFGLRIKVEGTFELSRTAGNSTVFTAKIDDDACHACDFCATALISFYFVPSVKITLLGKGIPVALHEFEIPFLKAHGSYYNGKWDFDIGECENNNYALEFHIDCTNQDGKSVNPGNCVIKVSDMEFPVNGNPLTLYCKKGANIVYQLSCDDEVIINSKSFSKSQANEREYVYIHLQQAKDGKVSLKDLTRSDPPVVTTTAKPVTTTTTTTTTTLPKNIKKDIETGWLSANEGVVVKNENGQLVRTYPTGISYVLYDDGTLLIAGHGRMKDFDSSPFKDPTRIKKVYFRETDPVNGLVIENIGKNLFTGASNMRSSYLVQELPIDWKEPADDAASEFVLPRKITEIGSSAFRGCEKAAFGNLTLPESVTAIGSGAFSGCKGITSLTIPEGCAPSLGSYAFSECTSMTKAVLTVGMTEVGSWVFSKCTALEDLTIPAFATVTADYGDTRMFSYFDRAEVPGINGMYQVESWQASGGPMTYRFVPNSLKHITVLGGTEILPYYFHNMYNLESVTCKDAVASIDQHAFGGCKNLHEIKFADYPVNYLPNTLEQIEENAFENCSNLAFGDLLIPKSMTKINRYAFSKCNGINSVYIPGYSEQITDEANQSVTNKRLNLGESVFDNCVSIKKAVLGDGIAECGVYLFNNCPMIEDFTLYSMDIRNIPGSNLGLNHIGMFFTQKRTYPDSMTMVCTTSFSNADGYVPNCLSHIALVNYDQANSGFLKDMSMLKSVTIPCYESDVQKNIFTYSQEQKAAKLETAELIGENEDWANITITKDHNAVLLNAEKTANPIVMFVQPVNCETKAGEKAIFYVAAAGKYALHYQWQYSADNGSTWTDTDCTEDEIVIQTTDKQNGWLYRCVVTDDSGKAYTLISEPAQLIISGNAASERPEGFFAGDVNGDNFVDVSDAVLLARLIAQDSSAKISSLGKLNADVNGDNNLTLDDTILILKYCAHFFDKFPASK